MLILLFMLSHLCSGQEPVFNGVFADPATFNKKVKLFFISNGSVEGNSAKDASEMLIKAGINSIVFYQSP
jgi:hypothetical protein